MSTTLNGYLCDLDLKAHFDKIIKAFFEQCLSKSLLVRNNRTNQLVILARNDPDLLAILGQEEVEIVSAIAILQQRHLTVVE